MSLLCLVAVAALAPAQTVRLALKFPKGRTDRMTANIRMDESFKGPDGQKISMAINEAVPMVTTVLSSTATQALVRMTYGKLKYSATVNGRAAPDPTDFGRLVAGKSVTLTFAPDGRVLKVAGLRELKNAALQGSAPQMRTLLDQVFNEDAVRQMWSMMFGGIFPRRPLRIGESWPSNLKFGQGPLAMSLNLRMKLLSVANGIASVGIGGTGAISMSGLPGGGSIDAKKVTIGGKLGFNLARGWLADQNMVIKIAAAVHVNGKDVPFTMTESVATHVQPVR